MFYSHNILSKRHGKFGIVWIAATKAVNPTRREYLTVDVSRSCDDIVQMITLRAEPFVTGGPRPRLSLYLSSQLMYGCVKVYNKQNDYLISDLMELNMKFRSFSHAAPIDLTDRAFQTQMLADIPMTPSVMMDPEFGRFRHTPPQDLSLELIPEVEVWQPLPDAESPMRQRPDIPLPQTPPQPHRVSPQAEESAPREKPKQRRRRSLHPDLNESMQARAADITLIEQPVQPPDVMSTGALDQMLHLGELDLPPMTAEAIAELDAAGETETTTAAERRDDAEPSRKRRRRASVPITPLYVGAAGDADERQARLTQQQEEFEARLEEQQKIIDEILERNDGDSQDMEADDAEELQRERRRLHQMQQEYEEIMAEFEEEIREVEEQQQQQSGVGFYQPETEGQSLDQVQLLETVTDATMQDDGRLAPAEETPAIMLGIPLDQVDVLPQRRGPVTPGVTPGSPMIQGPMDDRRRRREQYRLQLSPIATVDQVTPRHRRHLRFADAEIKLKREFIHHNLHNGHETCKSNDVPDVHFRSVSQLFDNPSRGLSRRFRKLWKRNTITKSVAMGQEDRSVWGVPGLLSSSESESERTPLARQLDDLNLSPVRSAEEQQQQELEAQMQIDQQMEVPEQQVIPDVSGPEVGRDATKESFNIQESIEAMREASRSRIIADEVPESSLVTRSRTEETPSSEERPRRRSRKSPSDDISGGVTPQVEEMPVIQEEREIQASPVLPPGSTRTPAMPPSEEAPALHLEEELESWHIRNKLEQAIRTRTEYDDVTTFRDVCPTSNTRKNAATMFSSLLSLCKRQKVIVQQKEPYADIYIARGERFNE